MNTASSSDSLLKQLFRKGRRPGEKQGTGGLYELYVVTDDKVYVAGGTVQYKNKSKAEDLAMDWLKSRRDVRAFVVTVRAAA